MEVLISSYAYRAMCFSDIVYMYSYDIILLYMHITKYGCVFLKLGGSTYVAMDLIPILFWFAPARP